MHTILLIVFLQLINKCVSTSDGKLLMMRLRCLTENSTNCKSLRDDALPELERLETILTNQNEIIKSSILNGTINKLSGKQLCNLSPELLLFIPVKYLSEADHGSLGRLLLCRQKNPTITKHLVTAVSQNTNINFYRQFQTAQLPEETLKVIAENMDIDKFLEKLPLQILSGQNTAIVEYIPPSAIVKSIDENILIYIKTIDEEDWYMKPKYVQRIWAYLFFIYNILPISKWEDREIIKFGHFLVGSSVNELNEINSKKIININALFQKNFSTIQVRCLFDKFYEDGQLLRSNSLSSIIYKLNPMQLQKNGFRKVNFSEMNFRNKFILLATAKQIGEYIARERKHTNLNELIKTKEGIEVLKELTFILPLHTLKRYKPNSLSSSKIKEFQHKQFTEAQIYFLTGRGLLFNNTDEYRGWTKFLQGVPTSYINRQISNSTLFFHLLSNMNFDSQVRSTALLNFHFILGNKKAVQILMGNEDVGRFIEFLPHNQYIKFAQYFVRYFKNESINLSSPISQLPQQFLSTVWTVLNQRKLSSEQLELHHLLKYLLNGITCTDIRALNVADFIYIISEYNFQREKEGKAIPKDLQLCCYKKFIEYIEMKAYFLQRLSSEGILSLMSEADIKAVGGVVLTKLPIPEIRRLPSLIKQIIRTIGKLSLPELMSSASKGYLRDLGELFITFEDGLELFDLGNLTMFVSDFNIRRMNSTVIRLMLESGYLDGRICCTNSEKNAWAQVIINAFGEPKYWKEQDLLTLGDMLIAMNETELDEISVRSWRNAGGLLKTNYNEIIHLKGPIPFYKACERLLNNEQEVIDYTNSIRYLITKYLVAAQYQLDSIQEVPIHKQKTIRLHNLTNSFLNENQEFTTPLKVRVSSADIVTTSTEAGITPNVYTTTNKAKLKDDESENSDFTTNVLAGDELSLIDSRDSSVQKAESLEEVKYTILPFNDDTIIQDNLNYGYVTLNEHSTHNVSAENIEQDSVNSDQETIYGEQEDSNDYTTSSIEESSLKSEPNFDRLNNRVTISSEIFNSDVESTKKPSTATTPHTSNEEKFETSTTVNDMKLKVGNNDKSGFTNLILNSNSTLNVNYETTAYSETTSMKQFVFDDTEAPVSIESFDVEDETEDLTSSESVFNIKKITEENTKLNGENNVHETTTWISKHLDHSKYETKEEEGIESIGEDEILLDDDIKNRIQLTSTKQGKFPHPSTESYTAKSFIISNTKSLQNTQTETSDKVKEVTLDETEFTYTSKIMSDRDDLNVHKQTYNFSFNEHPLKIVSSTINPVISQLVTNSITSDFNNSAKFRDMLYNRNKNISIEIETSVNTDATNLTSTESFSNSILIENKTLQTVYTQQKPNTSRRFKGPFQYSNTRHTKIKPINFNVFHENLREKRNVKKTVITCDAIKMVGIDAQLALYSNRLMISEMTDQELNDCIWEFGKMDLVKDIQDLIWNRINKADLYLAGKLLGSAKVSDITSLEFNFNDAWILETIHLLTTYNDNLEVISFIVNKISKILTLDSKLSAEALVSLGPALCQLENFTQITTQEALVLASTSLGRNKQLSKDRKCLSKIMDLIYKEMLGPPIEWNSEHLYSLGILTAGIHINTWKDIVTKNPTSFDRLNIDALNCLSKDHINALTGDALDSIPETTLIELKEKHWNWLDEKQRNKLNSVYKPDFQTPPYTSNESSDAIFISPSKLIIFLSFWLFVFFNNF